MHLVVLSVGGFGKNGNSLPLAVLMLRSGHVAVGAFPLHPTGST